LNGGRFERPAVARVALGLMRTVRVKPFLLTHEIVEKALLDELRLHIRMPSK
jgi:hypothetical protein